MLSVMAPCKHSARWQHLSQIQANAFCFWNERNDNRNTLTKPIRAAKWQQKSQVVFPLEFGSSH